MHTSNPAIINQSVGGVGHNIALASSYAGATTMLCSAIADDLTGRSVLTQLREFGLATDGVQVLDSTSDARTAQYVALNDLHKDLVVAMADMAILDEVTPSVLESWEAQMQTYKPNWIAVDANWSPTLLSKILSMAKKYRAKVAFEPVSNAKSVRLFSPDAPIITGSRVVPQNAISLATPNVHELHTMFKAAREGQLFDSPEWWETINSFEMSSAGSRDKLVFMTGVDFVDIGIPQQMIQLLPYIPNLVVKLGSQGTLLAKVLAKGDPCLTDPDAVPFLLSRTTGENTLIGGVYMKLFPPAEVVPTAEVVSVNGESARLDFFLIRNMC